MDAINDIEKQLVNCIFKYRGILKKRQYLNVQEREADRKKLNELYQQLVSIKQKILDSKCYHQLAELQKELSVLLLADETTASERIQMLSYIVRCACHPVVFIPNRAKLGNFSEAIKIPEQNNLFIASKENLSEFATSYHAYEVSQQQLEVLKTHIKHIIEKYSQQLKQHISIMEAEIISQLAANKELTLKTQIVGVPPGVTTAMILKEEAL